MNCPSVKPLVAHSQVAPQTPLSGHASRWHALALVMLTGSLAADPVPERPRKPAPAQATAPVTSSADRQALEKAQAETAALRRRLDKLENPPAPVASTAPVPAPAAPPTATVLPATTAPTGIAAQRPGQPANLNAKDTFTDRANGVESPLMVVIAPTGPGGFMMGSPAGEEGQGSNEKQHRVTLSQPFALSQTEVTWAQWDVCINDGACKVASPAAPTPEWGKGQQPVINVSWNHARAYTHWLNSKLGYASSDPYRYRLPSEAEWEYAARAGNTGPFGFGKDASGRERNIEPSLARYDWSVSYQNSPTKAWERNAKPVASYPPNAFGLFDMHGNAWEWVADCYGDKDNGDYDKLPDAVKNKGAAHRENDETCPNRVLRGGSWVNNPRDLRAANRVRLTPAYRSGDVGFRLARMLPAGS